MNIHFAFQFGLGKSFSFSFAIGKWQAQESAGQKLSLSNDTSPDRDSYANKGNVVHHAIDRRSCKVHDSNCAVNESILVALPAEIRNLIYKKLLVRSTRIKNPNQYIGFMQTPIPRERQRIKDVDAAILRTCRQIYNEALPVLYGNNIFAFEDPVCVRDFRADGLTLGRGLVFNFQQARCGRLLFIRHMLIDFRPDDAESISAGRLRCWRSWLYNIFTDESGRFDFPSLERLILDFKHWELSDEDDLEVQPVLDKFKQAKNLKTVIVRGVGHRQTRESFRQGLSGKEWKVEVYRVLPARDWISLYSKH